MTCNNTYSNKSGCPFSLREINHIESLDVKPEESSEFEAEGKRDPVSVEPRQLHLNLPRPFNDHWSSTICRGHTSGPNRRSLRSPEFRDPPFPPTPTVLQAKALFHPRGFTPLHRTARFPWSPCPSSPTVYITQPMRVEVPRPRDDDVIHYRPERAHVAQRTRLHT
jgi:hypothetical protein